MIRVALGPATYLCGSNPNQFHQFPEPVATGQVWQFLQVSLLNLYREQPHLDAMPQLPKYRGESAQLAQPIWSSPHRTLPG